MKRFWIFLFAMMVMMGRVHAQHLFEHTYPIVSQENQQIRTLMNQVSVDSLTATIEHLQSYPTRRWDTPMSYTVQQWLYNTCQRMGFDTVFLHDFPVLYHDTLYMTSDNVIAIQKGLVYPDEYVMCGAHYDSYNNSPGDPNTLLAPGADDNASGLSGILETARLLSQCKFERSVVYCGFAAEEIGLYGSAAYAKDCADQLMDIVGYFNLDMIGYLEEGSEMQVNLIYVSRDSLLANYVFDFSHVYYPDMLIKRSWFSWGDSDFSSFNRNGYAAVHAFEDTRHSSPFIHTPNDVLGVSVNNMDQVKRFTELNLGLVATLAGLVSTGVSDEVVPSVTIQPNPADDRITVKGIPVKQVMVYNLMGQCVLSQSNGDEKECVIEVGSLAPGIYFVQMMNDDGRVVSAKFVKS